MFYNVDLFDVQHQIGSYGEAFELYEQIRPGSDLVLRWREALTAAANLDGYDNATFGYYYNGKRHCPEK
ncbi:hypothetical protein K1719_036411 [Acacia pycnantha]|nr:hypothetical protein K1719_036411 [Acacia pycnantha]